jgi:hypothetical protein
MGRGNGSEIGSTGLLLPSAFAWHYHVARSDDREMILEHGLDWTQNPVGSDWQDGNYFWDSLEMARKWATYYLSEDKESEIVRAYDIWALLAPDDTDTDPFFSEGRLDEFHRGFLNKNGVPAARRSMSPVPRADMELLETIKP